MRMAAVPEFHALVGNEAAEELRCVTGDAVHTRQALKKCFTRMMNCEKKVIVDQLNMLMKRVTGDGKDTMILSLHVTLCGFGVGAFSEGFLGNCFMQVYFPICLFGLTDILSFHCQLQQGKTLLSVMELCCYGSTPSTQEISVASQSTFSTMWPWSRARPCSWGPANPMHTYTEVSGVSWTNGPSYFFH